MGSESERIVRFLRERVGGLLGVYRFGSTGEQRRPDSDVDVALLAQRPARVEELFELAQHLASRLGRDVDLLDLRTASTVMAAQVLSRGERLYCADEGACDAFETRALSAYALLNEERAGILQDIAERGTVYG